ncbi:MAG: SCO family protein [Vulcanimicrobiaceae bacterium]
MLRALASAALAGALCACARTVAIDPHAVAGMVLQPPPRAAAFALTDQRVRRFSLAAQHGHAVAIYFGYTHCTDMCPDTMAAFAKALRRAHLSARNVRIVFITVDPRRDTPAAIGRWLDRFDPRFVGLTGTSAQLLPVYHAYHIFFKNDSPASIEHGTTIFFIDPHGRLRIVLDASGASVDDLTRDLRAVAGA